MSDLTVMTIDEFHAAIRAAAAEYRRTWNKESGYVIVWQGKAVGFRASAPMASDYLPGVLAVGADGQVWQATGIEAIYWRHVDG